MNSATSLTWYNANFQYLLASMKRVRQMVQNYCDRAQNPPAQTQPEIQLSPEVVTALQEDISTLERLCTLFGLSPFERDILLMCAALELDPSFAELCAKANGNSQQNYPTLNLAVSAFPEVDWGVLSSLSPLQYWNFIEIEPGRILTQSPLRINRRILCYLLGEPCLDDELVGLLNRTPTDKDSDPPLPPSHQQIADEIVETWSDVSPPTSPVIQLCGSEMEMRLAIAAAVCTSFGLSLAVLSASRIPTHPQEIGHFLKRCCREANLTGLVVFLDCDDLNREDTNRTSAILQFIEGFRFLLIIGSQERQRQRERPLVTFEVGKLALVEKREIWQSYLKPVMSDLNGQVERLAAQFNLSPATIKTACLSVKERENKSKIGEVLWDFCRTQSRPQLEDLAQRIETHATWEDLILPEEKKEILRDILTHVRQQAKVYEEWEFAKQGSRGLGITTLFSGQSGTGKTMAAEVLAKELRLDLSRIDLSAVVSKYIGETEKNLRRIFDAAEGGGTILLFDEADALFGKRTQVKDSHDRHANVEVSYLLQRMEAYRGLAILTTNLKDALDVAFLRRLRFSVDFPFPDTEARMQIWERIFPQGTPTDSLDFKKLSSLNAPGGNIRSIALNAAFIAAEEREPVRMNHILQATQKEYVKLGRILTDKEVRGWVRAGG